MTTKAVTYSSYLRIDELLDLQTPRSDGPEHDELLFIVIHQVYELWFKQLIHEAAALQRSLETADATAALHTLRRMLTILKVAVAQVDVIETITPLSFSSFRGRLESASGFQSPQFREWEAMLGKRDRKVLEHHPSAARARIEQAMDRRSVWDSMLVFLAGRGIDVTGDVEAALIGVYRSDAIGAMVCERLVDLDEGFQEWRYRHVKMVERTLGSKPGTGGSAGVGYLRQTLFAPSFPELWAIRSEL